MKTMYDSVDAALIPADAQIVAGYDDGALSRWSAAAWARFPNARKVHITATGETLTSEVADVERGDLTADDAAAWIRRRTAAGIAGVPAIYCAASAVTAVQAACAGLEFDLWIADWTGVEHLPDGAAACQWAAKGVYDISACADFWPRDAAPSEPDPLIGALAYVADSLGDRVSAAAAELQSIQAEMQRVRVQFLGERAA